MAILLSGKANLRTKKVVIKDKERHYIMIEKSILQENITILTVSIPSNRASKYVRQKLLKPQGEIDKSTIIVEMFNTPQY